MQSGTVFDQGAVDVAAADLPESCRLALELRGLEQIIELLLGRRRHLLHELDIANERDL